MRSPWTLVWALIPLTAPAQPVVPAYEGCVITLEWAPPPEDPSP